MTVKEQARYWLLFALGFFLLLYLFRAILMPFVAGMIIAYFLDPLADRLEAMGANRTLSVSIITAAFFLVLVLAILAAVPLITSQITGFIERLPDYIAALEEAVTPLILSLLDRLDPNEVQELVATVKSSALDALKLTGGVVHRILSSSAQFLSVLSLVFITPIVAFYMLRDWDVMVARVDSWLPRRYAAEIRSCMAEIDTTIAGFVRGQATVCAVLGLGYGIGLSLVGLEFGFIIGLFTGLISFIPYFGMMLGLLVGMGVAIAQFSDIWQILAVAAVFGVGQVIEGNFLTPKLVGDRVGLHAVWVLFALLAGGVVFGFVGVMLAVPVAAVIGVLVRRGLRSYLDSSLYDPSLDRPDDTKT